jgi:transcriptional regulator with XRE-family HTH domain
MIYEEIGKRIQKAREEAQLSQAELASRLGLTQAALSNYELGKRRLDLSNLEKIAKALNRPLVFFLEGSGKATESSSEEQLDETVSEMISLWYDMPEGEKKYLLDYIKWRRDRDR